MSEQQHYPWNEGQPTGPDVDALLKTFPFEAITPGWRVTDEQVKACIGRCDGTRYRTVYAAWARRLLKDFNVIVYREEMAGFYCPTPEQVFARTHPTLRHIGRAAKKQVRHLGAVQPTTEAQRLTQDHQGRLMHSIARESKKARMNVLPPAPCQPTPSIEPPKRATRI